MIADRITMADVRRILKGEVTGGETHPDGDSVQIMADGEKWQLFLSESFGDAIPSDADILRTVTAVGFAPCSIADAIPVDRSAPESMTATVQVKAIGGYSLAVTLTRELKALGVGQGDWVKVTVERAD